MVGWLWPKPSSPTVYQVIYIWTAQETQEKTLPDWEPRYRMRLRTGTYGGINRATYSFWRSVAYSGLTDGGAAVTSANIQGYMDALAVQLIRGTDKPDLNCL
jgi:hypothetical protein